MLSARHLCQKMWSSKSSIGKAITERCANNNWPIHQHTRCFAGHNKWSKIRHKKGARDVSRAKEFLKATKSIRVASRLANGDMSNLLLQSAISRAKSLQVPKDRIMDAIKGANKGNEDDLISIRYDCRVSTSSGKVAFIIMAVTNNKNRTFTSIRTAVSKAGGEMLNTGANDWLFDHVGVALIHKNQRLHSDQPSIIDSNDASQWTDSTILNEEEKDEILGHCLEAGADDVDFGLDSDQHFMIQCSPNELHTFVMKIRTQGYMVSEFESRFIAKPDCSILLDHTSSDELSRFLEKLDDEDDVNAFYHIGTSNDE